MIQNITFVSPTLRIVHMNDDSVVLLHSPVSKDTINKLRVQVLSENKVTDFLTTIIHPDREFLSKIVESYAHNYFEIDIEWMYKQANIVKLTLGMRLKRWFYENILHIYPKLLIRVYKVEDKVNHDYIMFY